jgi:mannose-1-phosphate guanylyltransferase/mannose-6-phosphate isomerase
VKVIILASGKGTRLWPLSREKYSKQFLKLMDGTPLIEVTILEHARNDEFVQNVLDRRLIVPVQRQICMGNFNCAI